MNRIAKVVIVLVLLAGVTIGVVVLVKALLKKKPCDACPSVCRQDPLLLSCIKTICQGLCIEECEKSPQACKACMNPCTLKTFPECANKVFNAHCKSKCADCADCLNEKKTDCGGSITI